MCGLRTEITIIKVRNLSNGAVFDTKMEKQQMPNCFKSQNNQNSLNINSAIQLMILWLLFFVYLNSLTKSRTRNLLNKTIIVWLHVLDS